jgi:hypothetical protein
VDSLLAGPDYLFTAVCRATPDSYNDINSATKSVTSALIGIAQRDGLLSDLDEPVVRFFPEIEVDDERKRRISLRHLLTMTSGFVGVAWLDLERLLRADDPVRFIWQRPMASEPGRRFAYDDAALQLLSIILSRVTSRRRRVWAVRSGACGTWGQRAEGARHTLAPAQRTGHDRDLADVRAGVRRRLG